MKSLKTQIEDGVAVVQVEFLAGSDPARKRDEVLRETSALRGTLPPELARLDVKEFNAANVNVLQLALVSEAAPYRELERLARALRQRLEAVPGVGDGARSPGSRGWRSGSRSTRSGWRRSGSRRGELLEAVGAEARSIPAGAVDAGARALAVKTSGDYGSVDEMADTAVRMVDGRTVRVRDLAEVSLQDSEATHLARFGRPPGGARRREHQGAAEPLPGPPRDGGGGRSPSSGRCRRA